MSSSSELSVNNGAPRTIYDLLKRQAALLPDGPALYQPRGTRAKRTYDTYTWRDYLEAVREIAAGLYIAGIRKGDVVVLDSESRAEFYLCDLGVMACGGVSAALYTSSPPKEKIRIIETCRAAALFCEDAVSHARLASANAKLRLVMTGSVSGATDLGELRESGRSVLREDPELVDRLVGEIQPADPAILYLTSGATGESKRVLASHGAILANIEAGLTRITVEEDEAGFAFLPSAHIAQRLVMELMPIGAGAPVWFAQSLSTVSEEIREVKPAGLVAPPEVWEMIRKRILESMRRESRLRQSVFSMAMAAGVRKSKLAQQGKSVPVWLRLCDPFFERLVYSRIRHRLGGRLRVAISGAAPLSEDTAHFWAAVGITLAEGYGITEGGVVTFNDLENPTFGSVGRALPGVDLRVAEDGELLIRSPFTFSSYHNDAEATSRVLRDDWLHTGDIGRIGDDGLVYITGRKKEIILSSTGKNIFPAGIEALLRSRTPIGDVMLVGDELPHLAALITIDVAAARTLRGMTEWTGSPATIGDAEPVKSEVEKIVRDVNRRLAPVEQIKKFVILPRRLTVERGELTPTLKLRRSVVAENFKDHIQRLYDSSRSHKP